jgi:hypothetical protein
MGREVLPLLKEALVYLTLGRSAPGTCVFFVKVIAEFVSELDVM